MHGPLRIFDRLCLIRPTPGKRRRRVWCRPIGAVLSDRTGVTALALAISLSALAGLAGLGTEAASWYSTKRAMQGAADMAASTAAAALAAGEPSSTFATEAKSVAASYHFVDGVNNTTVTIHYPPQTGDYQSSPAVAVRISQTQQPLLSGLFLSTGPTISTRAAALADFSKTGAACVVALDPNNETSMTTSGSVALSFPGCSLYVNSKSPSALNITGGATIDASVAYIVGGVGGTGLTATNGINTGVDPLIDPYLTAAVPAYSGCDANNYKVTGGGSETKTVGTSGVYVFCSGLTLTGGSSLTLGPGCAVGHRDLPGPHLHRHERDQFADRRGDTEHRWRHLLSRRAGQLLGRQPDRRGGVHPADRVDDCLQWHLELQQQLHRHRHPLDQPDRWPPRRIKHRTASGNRPGGLRSTHRPGHTRSFR
jgi:Flp pilus assembly protein TadG